MFSLIDGLDYQMAMRHFEEIEGLESLRGTYSELPEEELRGQYSYLYVLQKVNIWNVYNQQMTNSRKLNLILTLTLQ